MVWSRLLLIVAISLSAVPITAVAATCNSSGAVTGCINNGGVDLHGTDGQPGSGGGGGTGGGGGSNGGTGSGPIAKCFDPVCDAIEAPIITEPITLSDIASFRPRPGVQHMQPDGWTVPGLHTNFYAVTGAHIVHGRLLGQSAAVRFTPVAYHWTYGDGRSATRTTKGGTWSALGLHEFDRTPTSHVYARDGRYTIRLTIDFAAEYQFAGSPFYPIEGVIPLRANDLHITVDGAKTVLVEDDCEVNPSGPGC